MAKLKDEGTDFLQPEKDEKQLVELPGIIPVLFGNETYVSNRSVQPPVITQEDWLLEAKEAQTVLLRGDHVSPELIERLFLQAVPVVETAVPPVTRSKKDDEKKRES